MWHASAKRFVGSHLIVISSGATVVLNTIPPDDVGTYVGNQTLTQERPGGPATMAALIAAREDWVGEDQTTSGGPRISAYAYSPELNGLIGVRVPAAEVYAEIPQMVLPWALGLGAVTAVLFLLTLAFLHRLHRRADAALRESEERYRVVAETATDAILTIDEHSTILFANPAAEKIFGYSPGELLGQSLTLLMPEHLRDRHKGALGRYLNTGQRHIPWAGVELPGLRKSGEEIPLEISFGEMVKGRQRFFTGIVRDISERQRAQEALRDSEERYRLLFEQNPQPMWVYDLETLAFLAVNAAAVKQYGYSREEFLGMTIRDVRPAEDMPRLLEDMAATKENLAWAGLWRHRKKDGTAIDVEITSHAFEWGGRRGRLVLAQDVTERRRLEAEQQRFFAVSNDLLCVAGFDGFFKRLNPAWTKTLGYSMEELLSRPYLEFVHPDDRAGTLAEADKVAGGASVVLFENRYRAQDGTYRHLLWSGTPVPEEHLIYAAATDITEHKRLQEQFQQAQKMEAVGRLAGGVAHDFNNLLMVIGGHSELLIDRLGRDHPLRRHAEEVHKTAERATSLTRQLLAFSRKQVLQPRVLNLNTVVADIEQMLRRLIGEDIELALRLHPELGRAKADPSQLSQVIMNLAVNARDAMPRGGQLTLETDNIEFDAAYTQHHLTAEPGSYVMLAVSDTGHGMDKETLARLFEPFFTTKVQGKGTGLGLATVYGIVKQSGGYIWVYSEVAQGTTFKVYLPRVEEAVEAPVLPEPLGVAAPLNGADHTVLLVEDEELLRKLVRAYLESNGYRVLEAGSGREAIRLAETNAQHISLLMTDVIMPGMTGRELAEHLTARHPHVKVLYMSGYTDDAIVNHGVLEPGMAFLQKPFTLDDLSRKLQTILAP
ncbi:MAG: PAS domain S-box protein [Candidatus Acidiferrales bacterium]